MAEYHKQTKFHRSFVLQQASIADLDTPAHTAEALRWRILQLP